jgi:NADH:ubiquinone oxidoreductase subunit D
MLLAADHRGAGMAGTLILSVQFRSTAPHRLSYSVPRTFQGTFPCELAEDLLRLLRRQQMGDAVAIIGSLDGVVGEVNR